MHGTWGELDGVPTVGSLQLETIDRNDVTFESFPPDRLRDFIRDVTACRDQVAAIWNRWIFAGAPNLEKVERWQARRRTDFRPKCARARFGWFSSTRRIIPRGGPTVTSIAAKIGCTAQSLNEWVKKAETDSGVRGGVRTEIAERLKALERENRELRQANEILRKASAYFTRAELDRRFKP